MYNKVYNLDKKTLQNHCFSSMIECSVTLGLKGEKK